MWFASVWWFLLDLFGSCWFFDNTDDDDDDDEDDDDDDDDDNDFLLPDCFRFSLTFLIAGSSNNYRSTHGRCSIKKLLLKTSQYSQENKCVGDPNTGAFQ